MHGHEQLWGAHHDATRGDHHDATGSAHHDASGSAHHDASGSAELGSDERRWAQCAELRATLEAALARHGGLLVLRNASLPGAALASFSRLLGGGALAARHLVHPRAVDEDVLRLSNAPAQGVTGVGGQWHHDGAFERRPFSHVLFHAQRMPSAGGGGTLLAPLAPAVASLSTAMREEWAQLASVNAFSGAVHPLLHRHPTSGQLVLFLHLAQTGAFLRWPRGPASECEATGERAARYATLEAMDPSVAPPVGAGHRTLSAAEARALLRTVHALLDRHALSFTYEPHDLLIIDNLAVAHRAAPDALKPGAVGAGGGGAAGGGGDAGGALDPAGEDEPGLRIMHRTTVKGTHALDPPRPSGLPPFVYVWGDNPLDDGGVWQGSDYWGAGFAWNTSLTLRN